MADEHLMSLQPGTVIAARYEVVKCLGAGSMGLVYACRHKELSGHLVAIKVLFPEVAQDRIAAARFRNEIFASYGVSHPNVVRAYEYLRDGDLVAYTMEYVGGGDLAERLGRADDRMTVPEVIRVLSQMCSGVQAIHDAGIVHRDLKPENILLTKDNNVKIADFGIARTGHGPKLTEHGGVVGTIDYVSPEYMLNSQVDWRSDIYAIGMLGYEMMTGVSPFRGDSVYATMTKRLKTDPKPPSHFRPEVPAELDRIILKAMHRNPELRYQSAAEMFYDLQTLAPEQTISSGAYLQISRRSSGSYVGPRVNVGTAGAGSGEDANAARPPARGFDEDERDTQEFLAEDFAEEEPSNGEAELPAEIAEHSSSEIVVSRAAAENYYGTQVLSSQLVSMAQDDYLEQPAAEPARMERLLNYKDMVSEGWESPAAAMPREIVMQPDGSGENKLQRLSQLVDKVNRSIWIDVATLVVAVLIGVGVGFAFLRIVFPDFMAPQASESQSFDVQALSDE